MLCVLLAMALMVSNDAAMKLAARELPFSECVFLRAALASLCALAALAARGELAGVGALWSRLVLVRGALEVISAFCFIAAISAMPIGDATAIIQIAPLLLLVTASIVWRERVGAFRVIACCIGFAGALLVAAPSGHISPAALFALLTAVAVTLRETIARLLGAAAPALALAFVTCLMVAAASSLGAVWQPWLWPDLRLLALTLAAGACIAGGYVALTVAIRIADVQAVAPFYFSQTIFALATGRLIFGEIPGLQALAGTVLVLAAGGYVFASRARAPAAVTGAAQ